MIRGEYWLIDGNANYADGDVSDTNHSGYALDHLRRNILSTLDIDVGDCYDWEEEVKKIPEALSDKLGLGLMAPTEPLSVHDIYDELREFIITLDLDIEDLDYAFERGGGRAGGDIRNYMSMKYGWVTCAENRIGTWHMTRSILATIVRGIDDILEQEGNLDPEEDEDFHLIIFVASRCRTYSTHWHALKRGDFEELGIAEVETPIGPNAQVAKMDRDLEPSFYRNEQAVLKGTYTQ